MAVVEIVSHDGFTPEKATDGAAGFDVRSNEDVVIPPGMRVAVGTGLEMAIEEGFEVQVRPRSGLAFKHGVTVLNAPGTIDSDYRGEVKVCLINHGHQPFTIGRGDRIAQLVVSRVEDAYFVEVNELDTTVRGVGGFGSTGVN